MSLNVKHQEVVFEVQMVLVKKCEDDYKASLKHINETKEKVWNHIIMENEKQSKAIANIKNPIEEFRLEILDNGSTVKGLQEVIRQECAKNAPLKSRIEMLEE